LYADWEPLGDSFSISGMKGPINGYNRGLSDLIRSANVSEREVLEVLLMAWSSECCSLGARVAPHAQRFGVALAVHRQPHSVGSWQRRGGALAEWARAWRISRQSVQTVIQT